MIPRFFRKSRQTEGWLALRSVGDNGVQLAQVRPSPDASRPEVLRCEFVAAEPDAKGLERLRRQYQLERFDCIDLLNPGEYQVLTVDAPPVPPAELKSAVRWRLKDLLDYPVDQATVDVVDIPLDGAAAARGRSVLAVAARNDTIRERMERFRDARLPLKAIDIPEMAQRNLSALCGSSQGLALLAFDAGGGILTFTYRGELYLYRRIDITLGQLQDANESLRQQSLERVALELQRSLDHFDRQYNFISLGKLMLGPLPEAAGLKEFLARNLFSSVESLDLGSILDLSRVPELEDAETQCDFLHVLGAALRPAGKVTRRGESPAGGRPERGAP